MVALIWFWLSVRAYRSVPSDMGSCVLFGRVGALAAAVGLTACLIGGTAWIGARAEADAVRQAGQVASVVASEACGSDLVTEPRCIAAQAVVGWSALESERAEGSGRQWSVLFWLGVAL